MTTQHVVVPKFIQQKTSYNTLELPNVAKQSIRYVVNLHATAAIATATLIDAGLITEKNKTLVIDHNKIKKAQEIVIKAYNQEFDDYCKNCNIECIFVDDRQDKTKVLLKAGKSNQKSRNKQTFITTKGIKKKLMKLLFK